MRQTREKLSRIMLPMCCFPVRRGRVAHLWAGWEPTDVSNKRYINTLRCGEVLFEYKEAGSKGECA
jgi:hypothetical protein